VKVLFIGGTGNISADCAALLHGRGHEIVVVTRGRSAVPAGYRAVVADRKDPAAMRVALAGIQPEVVVNFLGYEVGDVAVDFELFRDRLRQYIFVSTTAAYVKPPRRLPVTEDEPLGNPFWDYGQKKEQCERWLCERRDRDGFPLTIVRPSHTYSPRWFPNIVASGSCTLAARLEAGKPVFLSDDGEGLWTMTATSDFAVGFAGLAGNERALGEAFQITGDEVLTWNRILAETADALGVKSPQVLRIPTEWLCTRFPELTGPIKGDKACPGVFDNSKIKRLVPDFRSCKPFRAGIRESVAWYRANPDQRTVNPIYDRLFDDVAAAWKAEQTTLASRGESA